MAFIRQDGVLLCDACGRPIRRGTYAVLRDVIRVDDVVRPRPGAPFAVAVSYGVHGGEKEQYFHFGCNLPGSAASR